MSTLIEESCRSLPVFPLSGVVLMPGTVLPLHVFEPRYRMLVADVLSSDRVFGVATPRPPVRDGGPCPDLHPLVGVGKVIAHEPLPDGRSHILLEHVGVARILHEIDAGTLYRRVRAEPLALVGPAVAVHGLRALLGRLATAAPVMAPVVRALAGLDDAALVDVVAQHVLTDADDRLRYLGCRSFGDRLREVEAGLASRMAAAGEPVAEA